MPTFMMATGYMLFKKDGVTAGYVAQKVWGILRLVLIWNAMVMLGRCGVAVLRGSFTLGKLSPLLLLTMIGKSLIQHGALWQFWYFGALLIVYLALPLLLWLKNKGWLWQTWGVLVTICLGIQLVSTIRGESLQDYVSQTLRVWSWLQYTCLGGLMPEIIEVTKKRMSLSVHGILLLAMTVVMLVYKEVSAVYILHTTKNEYYLDGIIVIFWVSLLFTYVLRVQLPDRLVQITKFAHPLSMGVYVVHPLWIRLAERMISVNTVPFSIAYFLMIAVLSFVSVWMIEAVLKKKIPVLKWLFKM